MKRWFSKWVRLVRTGVALGVVLLLLEAGVSRLCADQVQMVTGDQYFGHVVSVSADTVVLQSQVLGTLRLPRTKVAQVSFGTNPLTNAVAGIARTNAPYQPMISASTNALPELSPALRQLGKQTNLIGQIRRQFLADAGPEANAKFDELLNGLLSGQLNMGDLRSQAQNAADQIRSAKKDLGPEAGGMLDTYLTILDHFLKETSAESGTAPAAPRSKAKTSAPASDAAEE